MLHFCHWKHGGTARRFRFLPTNNKRRLTTAKIWNRALSSTDGKKSPQQVESKANKDGNVSHTHQEQSGVCGESDRHFKRFSSWTTSEKQSKKRSSVSIRCFLSWVLAQEWGLLVSLTSPAGGRGLFQNRCPVDTPPPAQLGDGAFFKTVVLLIPRPQPSWGTGPFLKPLSCWYPAPSPAGGRGLFQNRCPLDCTADRFKI